MKLRLAVTTSMLGFALAGAAWAQTAPRPPANLTAVDHPLDDGTRIDLSWTLSPDDAEARGYVVRRRDPGDDAFNRVDAVPAGTRTFTVGNLRPGERYDFSVTAIGRDNAESAPATTGSPAIPAMQWFDGTRFWFLLMLVLFCGSVITLILLARRGLPMKVRHIAGLDMVDDAVGRATEMGRPCIFVPGVNDMNEIQTIAGINVLGRVSKTAAEYDA